MWILAFRENPQMFHKSRGWGKSCFPAVCHFTEPDQGRLRLDMLGSQSPLVETVTITAADPPMWDVYEIKCVIFDI